MKPGMRRGLLRRFDIGKWGGYSFSAPNHLREQLNEG